VGDSPPALLSRLAASLEGEERPVPLREIVGEILRLQGESGLQTGTALLEPLLRSDSRFRETPEGWTVRDSARKPSPGELEGPFTALGILPDPRREGGRLLGLLACDSHGREKDLRLDEADGRPAASETAAAAEGLTVSRRGRADLRAAGLARTGASAVPLAGLARALAGTPAAADLGSLAARLGLHHRSEEGVLGEARLAAALWLDLRERLRVERMLDPRGLERLLGPERTPEELETLLDPEALASLPASPGVYRFLDEAGEVLYVGKSVNLRARVISYFAGEPRDGKDRRLREEAAGLRAEDLGSEPEALLREQQLIRRHRPPLNIQRQVEERAGPRGDRLLVLPGPTPLRRTLIMIREGVLASRLTVGLRRPGREKARRALRQVFFESGPPGGGAGAEEGGRLLASWLRRHPHRTLSFDPLESAGPEEAEERLERFLEADPRWGPLFELNGSRS
jgi:hypothetical protein